MLVPIPALNDNYIWLYARENFPLIVIDLSETEALFSFLQANQLDVEAVLLTHNHSDHVQGVAEFKQRYPDVPIYASAECAEAGATHLISEGHLHTPNYDIEAIPTGGHTAEHLSFVVDGHLFCGDALFSAGCGRVFTGDYAQMFASMQRLNQLPASTIVCPAHEYTLSNLAFVMHILQQEMPSSVEFNMTKAKLDQCAVKNQRVFVQALRDKQQPSLPTTIALERQINPFLMAQTLAEFVALRTAKDVF